MNAHLEFDKWADQNGISRDAYALNNEEDERFCAVALPYGDWTVFYSERGERIDTKDYATEEAALLELQRRLLEDPTTRTQFRARHRWPGRP